MHKTQHNETAAQKLTYNSLLPPHKITNDKHYEIDNNIYIHRYHEMRDLLVYKQLCIHKTNNK